MSVEITHQKISKKLSLLIETYEAAIAVDPSARNRENLQRARDLRSRYMMKTAAYVSQKSAAYFDIISTENILQQLQNHVWLLRTIEASSYVQAPSAAPTDIYSVVVASVAVSPLVIKLNYLIVKTTDALLNLTVEIPNKQENHEVCCGGRMQIIPEQSELVCAICGRITTLYGIIFRDDQFYTQENNKSKHGKYEPNRHYKLWIERIQAIEVQKVPAATIERLRAAMLEDDIALRRVSCKIVRVYLKRLRLTSYNNHAAQIAKELSGSAPPRLSRREDREANWKFNACMEEFDRIADAGYRPYYPHYIYKILESMFENDSEKLRILEYIHLQEDDTVIKNDKWFEQICACIGDSIGIVFKPTAANE